MAQGLAQKHWIEFLLVLAKLASPSFCFALGSWALYNCCLSGLKGSGFWVWG